MPYGIKDYNGNIDLNRRVPVYAPNGATMTEASITIDVPEENPKYRVLIPSVVNGKKLDWRAAIDHFYKTGENLGHAPYPKNQKEAQAFEDYANRVHERQGMMYVWPGNHTPDTAIKHRMNQIKGLGMSQELIDYLKKYL